jgi:hypothetical protein
MSGSKDGAFKNDAKAVAGVDAFGNVHVLNTDPTGTLEVTLTAEPTIDIGKVDQGTSGTDPWTVKIDQSGDNNDVDVIASVLPTGASTETTLSAAKADLDEIALDTDKLDVNLSTVAKAITQTDGTQKTQVTNFPATQPVSGSVSVSNFPATQTVAIDQTGDNNDVDVISSVLPTGAATSAAQTDGTQKTQVTNFPATQSIAIDQTGDNNDVDVTAFPLDSIGSGTITANGQTLVFGPLNGTGSSAIQITGTWTGQIEFEVTVDGSNWVSRNTHNGTVNTNATQTNGIFVLPTAGFNQTRVRSSSWTSGTATINFRSGVGAQGVTTVGPLPAGTNALGSVSVSNLPASQVVTEANVDLNFGTWGYAAGVSGTPTIGAGKRVIGISAHCTIAGSMTINGGNSIPIPANVSMNFNPLGNLTNPTIVFTGTDSFIVEFVS